MFNFRNTVRCAGSLLLLACFLTNQVKGQSLATFFESQITDDVVAVGFVDLTKTNLVGLKDGLESKGIEPDLSSEIEQAFSQAADAQQQIQNLRQMGLSRIYALFRTSDINTGDPLFVVPVDEGNDPKLVLGLFEAAFRDRHSFDSKIVDDKIYLAHGKSRLDQILAQQPDDERDFSSAFEAIEEASAALVIFGDSDTRRVIRELLPRFQVPANLLFPGRDNLPEFPEIEGRLIADDLNWMAIRMVASEQAEVQVEIDLENEASAATLNKFLSGTLDGLLGADVTLSQELKESLANHLRPQLEGRRNRIELSLQQIDNLALLLTPSVKEYSNKAKRTHESNKLKMMALAMHNYESAHGHFPDPLGTLENGQPGLSWRVHILPYIEEFELYNKFNLDEPWNSEANLALVEQMPLVYESPLLKKLEKGKTVYQLPFSATAAFRPGAENPLRFRDVIDGASNTLMIVATEADQAAIWTKPQDWNVDDTDPWKGLRLDENQFRAALMDGSVRRISKKIGTDMLKALITPNGGEVIDLDSPEDKER